MPKHSFSEIVTRVVKVTFLKGERVPAERKFVRLLVLTCAVFLLMAVFDETVEGSKREFPDQRPAEDEPYSIESGLAEAHYRLGVENLYEPSNSDRAIEYLEKAVELESGNAEYHYRLAEAYRINFQCAGFIRMPFIAPKVEAHLEWAVKYDPRSTTYREALLRYYVYAPAVLGGSYRKAHEQADEIARLDPYLGMLARAEVYSEEGEGEQALALYKDAVLARPMGWQAYQRFGAYYLSIQQAGEAIAMSKKYIEVAPEQAEGFVQLGQAYEQKKMYDDAIVTYQKAFEKNSSLAPLVFRIAQLLELKGERRLAHDHYRRYLSMVPRGRAADDARIKIKELGRQNGMRISDAGVTEQLTGDSLLAVVSSLPTPRFPLV